jgi:hypothetical protein
MKVSVSARMRRARRGAILSAGGVVVTAGVLLVVMTPSLASATMGSCGYGNSSGNIRTCMSVATRQASATAQVVSSARVVSVCIYVNGSIQTCTPFTYLQPGQLTEANNASTDVIRGGTFCALTRKEQPDGSVVSVDQECVGF